MELKKLNLVTFTLNCNQLYILLDNNRARLSPWFWWAARDITPNKLRFYWFVVKRLADTRFVKVLHGLDSTISYDQQFIVYNSKNKIGGLCGLDDIDTVNKRAEVWGLAFRGNTETIEAMTELEDYCITNLQLKSIYACVKSTNRASQLFWEKYGYDKRRLDLHVKVSQHNPKYADIYTYTRELITLPGR